MKNPRLVSTTSFDPRALAQQMSDLRALRRQVAEAERMSRSPNKEEAAAPDQTANPFQSLAGFGFIAYRNRAKA